MSFLLICALLAGDARIAAARELAGRYVASHKWPVRERNAEPIGNYVLVRYDQVFGGVRVFGGQVNLDVTGSAVRVAYSKLLPSPHVNVQPKITPAAAATIAIRRTALTDVTRHSDPALVILPRSSFARNLPSSDRLAWQVDVWTARGPAQKQRLFIDAQNGDLLYDTTDLVD